LHPVVAWWRHLLPRSRSWSCTSWKRGASAQRLTHPSLGGGGDTLFWERRKRAFEFVAARHELGVWTREAEAAEAFVAFYEADFAWTLLRVRLRRCAQGGGVRA
jgi:hypothetical protein